MDAKELEAREAEAQEAERKLVLVLQAAYSGELAAARAYAGHARSVRDADQRREILAIRDDELAHRARVGEMLRHLGAQPNARRERIFGAIGRVIAALCRVGGWFAPMYGAGRLERDNVGEYERAARHALGAGHAGLVDDLLTMAEVEWDHERYFREHAARHVLARLVPIWTPPPPRAEIRSSFAAEAGAPALPHGCAI
jgi:rubrerythrin